VERLGKEIYEKDRAAWLATDRVVENGGLPAGLRGWVTVPSDRGWRVIFVEDAGHGACSRLSVLVDEKGARGIDRSGTCEPLTAEQREMFLARQTALSALRNPCSDSYNTVVLPYEGSRAAWVVYLLAATQRQGTVMVGGHVRVLIGRGGRNVVDYEPLSKSCLTLPAPASGEGQPVALVVTHVLDNHPIETHVYLSLLHKLVFYVMTRSAMWSVAHGRIKLLMRGKRYRAYIEKARAAGHGAVP